MSSEVATVERGLPTDEAAQCVGVCMPWHRKIWRRWTLPQHSNLFEEMISITTVRLSFIDRVMVLFGRDIQVRMTCNHEPDMTEPKVHSLIDELRSSAVTRPRGWS